MITFLGSTKPLLPSVGDTYYDTNINALMAYDGYVWVDCVHPTSERDLLWNACIGITFEKEQGIYNDQ